MAFSFYHVLAWLQTRTLAEVFLQVDSDDADESLCNPCHARHHLYVQLGYQPVAELPTEQTATETRSFSF